MGRILSRGVSFVADTTPPDTFDPTDVATLEAWWDGDDLSSITESSNAVSQWDDKSGNSHDLVQATGANQPTYTTSVLAGRAGIVFDGTNDRLSNTSINMTRPYAVLLVCKTDNATGGDRQYAFDGRTTSPDSRSLLALRGDSTNRPSIWAGSWGQHADTTDTNFHVFRAYFNGASSSIGIDGDVDATADFLDGTICEIVVLDSPSASDMNDIEGYLAWRWGLQANLESGHPYESAPP